MSMVSPELQEFKTMMRPAHVIGVLFGFVLLTGCGRSDIGPRFAGTVVSHVDGYGSGTGGESALRREGSMTSGFDYGDPSKPDWTSDIRWSFLRRDGGSDVYRMEWTFRPANGAGRTESKEIAFDGRKAVRAFGNQWQVISIEPGPMKTDSQHAPASDASEAAVPYACTGRFDPAP
jgi:hypothetical protein